ncbi:MAG TPA: regulatory protein RecX [Solirubrobacterales bacterium]|nr:regulatory protein RecX [Solirubrobacterales bacterium]
MDPDDREVQDALSRALATLRRRERTAAELHRWLRDRGCTEEIADAAVAELAEIGEVDDERFAYAYAADKRELAGWGAHRIATALRERGIGDALAERAAAEPRDDEIERAVGIVLSKEGDLGDDRARARALAHLTRRGYEHELAYEAVRRAQREGRRAA